MDPIKATTPDYEVDEFTGQLKRVELRQDSIVYSPINRNLIYTKAEVDSKLANTGSGTGTVKTVVAGTGISVDSSDPANPVVSATGSGGTSRSVSTISSDTTAGNTAKTDYVYFVSGTTVITLPTAASNTNLYTVKNIGAGTVTISTTSGQTIDGSAGISIPVRYTSVDLMSDGNNWNIV